MDLLRATENLPNHVLRYCLETRGLRKIALPFKSPAFFTPRHPHYGKLAEDLHQQVGEFRIVGFPKSGNVWLTSLVATCLNLDVVSNSKACRVTHTHTAMCNNDLFIQKLLRGAVLLRDLRDVLVSLYHFTRTDHFKRFHGSHHIYNSISCRILLIG